MSPGVLAGGEQQMVAVGRPLAALKAEGLTILLVEQNARAAFRIADRGYALSAGGSLAETRGAGSDAESARVAYGFDRVGEESSL